MPTEFKAGDRVRLRLRPSMGYDGPVRSSCARYGFNIGDTGTILADGDHHVAWDNGLKDPGWVSEALELLTPSDVMPDTREYLTALAEFKGE